MSAPQRQPAVPPGLSPPATGFVTIPLSLSPTTPITANTASTTSGASRAATGTASTVLSSSSLFASPLNALQGGAQLGSISTASASASTPAAITGASALALLHRRRASASIAAAAAASTAAAAATAATASNDNARVTAIAPAATVFAPAPIVQQQLQQPQDQPLPQPQPASAVPTLQADSPSSSSQAPNNYDYANADAAAADTDVEAAAAEAAAAVAAPRSWQSLPAALGPSVAAAWARLPRRARCYAHHLLQASWQGALAVPHQVSPESPPLLRAVLLAFGRGDAGAEDCKSVLLHPPYARGSLSKQSHNSESFSSVSDGKSAANKQDAFEPEQSPEEALDTIRDHLAKHQHELQERDVSSPNSSGAVVDELTANAYRMFPTPRATLAVARVAVAHGLYPSLSHALTALLTPTPPRFVAAFLLFAATVCAGLSNHSAHSDAKVLPQLPRYVS